MSRPLRADKTFAAVACLALLAAAVVVVRAYRQSITIDEADTYLTWVVRDYPGYWEPSANNHVLNSMLMRAAALVAPPSHLSVRAPAVLGALVYLGAAAALSWSVTEGALFAIPLFVCLAFNPLILDHLVAARGYSLGVGLWLAAVALAASGRRMLAACSVLTALAICANFSFAFVSAATMLGILWWFRAWRLRDWVSGVLPGAAVLLLIAAPAALHYPRDQIDFGATSLGEMVRTLAETSLYCPNPYVVNPLLLVAFERTAPFLLPIVAAASLCTAIAAMAERKLSRPAILTTAILFGALALHGATLLLWRFQLPKDRTATWVVSCAALLAGALAAPALRSRPGRFGRAALQLSMWAVAIYFLGCLRISHFKEWRWNADSRQVYEVIAEYHRRFGVDRIQTTWKEAAVLNFYRLASGDDSLPRFEPLRRFEPGGQLYVLDDPFDRRFANAHGLRIVYRGEESEISIAIDPRCCAAGHRAARADAAE